MAIDAVVVDCIIEPLDVDVLYALIAVIVMVYCVVPTNPVTVAGELVIPVCTTVVPLVGTAVAVYDVMIPDGGVNVYVIELYVVLPAVNPVGGDNTVP